MLTKRKDTKSNPFIEEKDSEETEDNYCDLDPTKICDNCFKCLEIDSDFAAVEIDGIYMNGDRIY